MTRFAGAVALEIVFDIAESTLSNGLRILVLELPHTHAVSMALMVRTGPRYETPGQNGISHLVEHLLFRGTLAHPSSLSFHSAVETLGGEINGLTQRDISSIHLTVPRRTAYEGLRMLGETCTVPLLTGLEVERDVVIEEILDSCDADGHDLDVDSLSRKVLWGPHPIGMPIAGQVEIVERLTEEECREHFENTFVTENAVLVIAGPVDAPRVFSVAAEAFATMRPGPRLPEPLRAQPSALHPIQVQPSDDSQATILLSYPAPHESDPDFPTLLLLKRVLDDGFGSRLRQAICEQSGLAYSMSAAPDAYVDVGAFDIEITCAPGKVGKAVARTLQTLEELIISPIGRAELERAKTRYHADQEFSLDHPEDLAMWHGASALMDREPNFAASLRRVLETEVDDLERVISRVFHPDNLLLTVVGPLDRDDTHVLERLLDRPADSTVWLDQVADEQRFEPLRLVR